jgi:hypothetical protein
MIATEAQESETDLAAVRPGPELASLRPIDQLRADIATHLLRGLPLHVAIDPTLAANTAKPGEPKTANPDQTGRSGQDGPDGHGGPGGAGAGGVGGERVEAAGPAAVLAGEVAHQVRTELAWALAGLSAKQQPGWHLIQVWPGLLLWITPAGRWYLTGPGEAR